MKNSVHFLMLCNMQDSVFYFVKNSDFALDFSLSFCC